jgi:hypothetical protein
MNEQGRSLLFQFIVSNLLLIFLCGYVNCVICYVKEVVCIIICACYSWETVLDTSLDEHSITCGTGKKYERKQGKLIVTTLIQGVLGVMINIQGGHSIGHSKKKNCIRTYMCPIPNGFRDRAIPLYSSKTVDKKEILRTVSNSGIYCSSDKVGTVYLV